MRAAAFRVVVGVAVAALGLAACTTNDTPSIGGGSGGTGQSADVVMQAMNGGQAGSATILESPTLDLSVKITLQGSPSTLQEPAGVHAGTCTAINPEVKFPLSSITNGTSTTNNLNTTLAELSSSPYVVVVQRSGLDATPVSCGQIPSLPTSP